jgi:hypothetical protein
MVFTEILADELHVLHPYELIIDIFHITTKDQTNSIHPTAAAGRNMFGIFHN